MMNLSDRDILMDLLLDSKHISTGYHQAVLEAATDRVRSTLLQIHDDELASHRTIFDLMMSRGYYHVQQATPGIRPAYQPGSQWMAQGQPAAGNITGLAGGAGIGAGGIMQSGPGMGAMQQANLPMGMMPQNTDISGRHAPGLQPGQ